MFLSSPMPKIGSRPSTSLVPAFPLPAACVDKAVAQTNELAWEFYTVVQGRKSYYRRCRKFPRRRGRWVGAAGGVESEGTSGIFAARSLVLLVPTILVGSCGSALRLLVGAACSFGYPMSVNPSRLSPSRQKASKKRSMEDSRAGGKGRD